MTPMDDIEKFKQKQQGSFNPKDDSAAGLLVQLLYVIVSDFRQKRYFGKDR
jgi:hypothetical protein